VTQPSEALWRSGGPLLASVAVGWLLLGLVLGAIAAGVVALVLGRRRAPLLPAGGSAPSGAGPDEVAAALLRQVEELPHVESAALVLVDADGRRAQGLRAQTNGRELREFRGVVFDLEHEPSGIASAVFEAAPFTVFDASSSRINRSLVETLGAKSIAYVPLVANDHVTAVLAVATVAERAAFATEELERLRELAAAAALALDHARATAELAAALERERERNEVQARVQGGLFQVASVLGRPLSLRETFAAMAQAANAALGGAFAAVLMRRGSEHMVVAGAELPSTLERELTEAAGSVVAVTADQRLIASVDLREDDRFEPSTRDAFADAGARALLGVPIAGARAQETGLVLVFFDSPRTFADEDLELARHIADAARGALARGDLLEAERTARMLSQQLARTGSALATELDPTAILDEVVEQARSLLAADACAIRTLDVDELVVSAVSGAGLDDVLGSRSPATAWLSGDVHQSRAPVAIEDASTDDRLVGADPILVAGYSGFLGVPLDGPDGAMHGVLALYSRAARTWRVDETDALRALAANTSAALSNAELYSRVLLEKERSLAILANVADGIVAVDREGSVVLWNAAAETITGVPADEALGRTPAQVLQRTLESETDEWRTEPRLVSITRSGEEVWLSLSEAVMRDPLGAVAGRIFAFRDISADRMVEQVKSDFVAAVSHELRTPLTSIYGFAETLLRQDVLFGEEEQRTFIGYIASESERLTGIVDQLLNVARLDAGDLHVEPQPIDVGTVVSEVIATVDDTTVNGHEVEIDLPAEPLAAEADRDKLRQVCNILVDNALKYSPDGGRVTVAARRGEGTVEVRVVDEGIGIPADEQERIFRKFYRAETTARDGGGGTGLGLFIAKELVTAMGGRIWVESAEGEGSKFTFELPAVRDDR
jgi:two-component system phosphate regulon sensor histidine kinase PhoR